MDIRFQVVFTVCVVVGVWVWWCAFVLPVIGLNRREERRRHEFYQSLRAGDVLPTMDVVMGVADDGAAAAAADGWLNDRAVPVACETVEVGSCDSDSSISSPVEVSDARVWSGGGYL